MISSFHHRPKQRGEDRAINFEVDERVHAYLTRQINETGMSVSMQAKTLFDAAYAVRCGVVEGDSDLDTSVRRVMILHGAAINPPDIAAAVGLSEKTVKRIVKTWRREAAGVAS